MEWSDWSDCSVTCGTGIHTRKRTCENGCSSVTEFELADTQACDFGPCAPIFTEWSDWSTCSVTCGTGIHTRTRTCENHCSSVTSSDLAEEQACDEGGPCGSPCINFRTDSLCDGILIQRTAIQPSPNGPSPNEYEAVGEYGVCASLCIGVPGCVSFNWIVEESWESTGVNCWDQCGQKGGKCSVCGESGYCCRNKDWKGDCPTGAIQAAWKDRHDCVAPKQGSL